MAGSTGSCLFCFKVFKKSQLVGEAQSREDFQARFITVLQRYLRDDNINLEKFARSFKHAPQLRSELRPCFDCSEIIETFCDYDRQVKLLEMRMNEKLWTLVSLMDTVTRSKTLKRTRVKCFRESITSLFQRNNCQKKVGAFLEELKGIRENIMKKCVRKITRSFPLVQLGQCRVSSNILRRKLGGRTENIFLSSPVAKRKHDAKQSTDVRRRKRRKYNRVLKTEPCEEYDDPRFSPPPTPSSPIQEDTDLPLEEGANYLDNRINSFASGFDPFCHTADVSNVNSTANAMPEMNLMENLVTSDLVKVELADDYKHSTRLCDEMTFDFNEKSMGHGEVSLDGLERSSKRKSSKISRSRSSSRVTLKCPTCSKAFASTLTLQSHQIACSKTGIGSESDDDNDNDDQFDALGAANMCEDEISEEASRIAAVRKKKFVSSEQGPSSYPPDIDFMSTPFPCKVSSCDYIFYNPTDLEAHSKLHGRFKCHFCDVTESFAQDISLHELNHASQKPQGDLHHCPRCSYKVKQIYMYQNHHLEAHMNLPSNQNTCPICNKRLFRKNRSFGRRQKPNFLEHYNAYHDVTSVEAETVKSCDHPGCSAYFLRSTQLLDHNAEQHPGADYLKCEDCNDFYRTPILYLQHRKDYHHVEASLPCVFDWCKGKFATESKFSAHMKAKHRHIDLGKLEFQRYLRRYNLIYEAQRKRVLENRTDSQANVESLALENVRLPSMHECGEPNCNELFFTVEDLLKHQAFHGQFQCKFCDEVRSFAPDISMHELSHKEQKVKEPNPSTNKQPRESFSCAQCSLSTTFQALYVNHHLTQHMNLPVPIDSTSCDICKCVFKIEKGTSFQNKTLRSMIKKHFQLHHDLDSADLTKLCWCDGENCSAYFLTPNQLQKHKVNVHFRLEGGVSNFSRNVHECADCHQRFKDRAVLRNHRVRAHGVLLTFSCPEAGCHECFETEQELRKHGFIHNYQDTASLVCPECGNTFRTPGALGSHIKKHEEAKSKPVGHPCSVCGKLFPRPSALKKHAKWHARDEWEFTCHICPKKFPHADGLRQHIRSHTGERRYCCEFCAVEYLHRSTFKKHMLAKHGVEVKGQVGAPKKYPKMEWK